MSKKLKHFDTLPDLPIEEICQNMLKEEKYGDLSAFVQTSKRIHSLCQKYLDALLEKHTKEIMKRLHILGPLYNGGSGLAFTPHTSLECLKKGDDIDWIKELIINDQLDVYPFNPTGSKKLSVEDIEKLVSTKNEVCLEMSYDDEYVNYLSDYKLNFNKIVIKYKFIYDEDTSKFIKWYNDEDLCEYLEPMSERSFIKVKKPLREVHLYKQIKDKPLTIDDILFASRALMVDPHRSIDKYFLISNNDDCLVLEAQIDNFST